MILKRLFDILASFFGLLILWPVLLIVAILVKVKMPGGPAFFVQKRVGKGGKLFNCHKFRSMIVKASPQPSPERIKASPQPSPEGKGDASWSSVSVAGDSRITPFGATLRHYKLDELPGLWDVLIGNMSFVGPRPDVPGYADKLEGDDRDVLKLRPGITGPATLKYRLEDEMLASLHLSPEGKSVIDWQNKSYPLGEDLGEAPTAEQIAVWYNDNVIYPDKVRLNCYYYRHYSFWKDIEMIFATVLGWKVKFAGEEV